MFSGRGLRTLKVDIPGMPNAYDLKNKKILVTGANGQLGSALVTALLQNGAFVYVTDIQEQTARQPSGGNYQYLQMDVTSAESIKQALKEVKELDVLINNAGIGIFTPFENRTEAEIDQAMDVNLKGTILCTKFFSQQMTSRRQGKIINIGSIYGAAPADKKIYGDSGRNSSEIYAATKAGVIHLTKYFAAYFGEYGLQVNAVSPGGIFNNQKPEFVDNYVRKTPLGRMAEPRDIIGAICFLASEGSDYITGQNLVIDGGFTLNQ